jgi:hypothetical protein
MKILFLTVLCIAAVVYVIKAVVWAIRADRVQRARGETIDEADDIAVMRRFHETLEGTLDQIRKRGG